MDRDTIYLNYINDRMAMLNSEKRTYKLCAGIWALTTFGTGVGMTIEPSLLMGCAFFFNGATTAFLAKLAYETDKEIKNIKEEYNYTSNIEVKPINSSRERIKKA